MNKNNKLDLKSSSSKAISFCLLGLTLTTLYFNTKLLDPFNTPKLIIVLVTASWLFGHLVDSYRKDKMTLKSLDFKVLSICILFIISLFLAVISTDVPIVGLIGETQRRNGFISYLALIIIFLFLTRFFTNSHVKKLLKIAIVLGLVLSLYGVMQIKGKDFVAWNNPYNSMIATLGNPNFASSLLAVLFLVCFFSIFTNSISLQYKIASGFFLVLAIFCIIESQSRQGLIVIGFGIIFYFSLYSVISNSKLKYVVLPTSLILVFISVAGMLQKGPLSAILYKDSVSVRGFYWRAGIEMFRSKPFTGIGVDRYESYFKQFREVEYPLRYGYDLTSSNAHNTIIQIFATCGIFTGIFYLMILFLILSIGIKLVLKSSQIPNRVSLGLLSSWVGFQSQSFISIDNIGISVWGWLLGGAIVGLYLNQNRALKPNSHQNTSISKQNIVQINFFQPIVSGVVLVPVLIFSTLLWQMESKSYDIRVFVDSGAAQKYKEQLLTRANEVNNNPVADPFYKFQAATSLVNIEQLQEAYRLIQDLNKADPRNLFYLSWLVQYYKVSNQTLQEINTRIQISKIDPWNAQNYLRLGYLYKESGNLIEELKIKEKILSFADGTNIATDARLNLS